MKWIFTILFLCLISGGISLKAQEVNIYKSYDEWMDTIDPSDGQTYVINFWATWCKPCVAELPYFEALHEKHDDIKVILVSLDFENQIESRLIPFIKKESIDAQVDVLLDPKSHIWIDKVEPRWNGAIPATLIITSDKRQFYEQSFHNLEELENLIK